MKQLVVRFSDHRFRAMKCAVGVCGLGLLAQSCSFAQTPVTLTINTTSVIRNDISRATFGSGVEHQNPQFRDLAAQNPTAVSNLNMGTFRFPQGTTGLYYNWKYPERSYKVFNDTVMPRSLLWKPSDAYNVTTQFNMERLFEVNTASIWNNWDMYPINANGYDRTVPAAINPTRLNTAADFAAEWVQDNTQNHASTPVTYWEVGNEDWSWWSPEQYAQIFSTFATKMKAKNANIKLLAQTITHPYTAAGNVQNGADWTNRMAAALGTNKSQVYALSYHKYLDGGAFASTPDLESRRWLQTLNMFADVHNNYDIGDLKSRINTLGVNWKIWATEINVNQSGTDGKTTRAQDLGHALIVADWVGKLLQSNVERVLIHSLDHHPFYSVVDYVNNGGTIGNPITTVPGYAFSIYAQKFGTKMVNVATANNPTIYSPNKGGMPQVSAYASILPSTTNPRLRLIVVNRSPDAQAQLNINTSGSSLRPANYEYSQLYSPKFSDSNVNNKDFVKWSAPTTALTNTAGVVKTVPPHSVSYFDIPVSINSVTSG